MSALTFARQAFGREKPHSSITDWVEILTSSTIEEEAYDGIPELVDAINLQASGPSEASRALRKKLKHGNPHQQYRSLVLLKALVENCGQKFQSTFADGHMTDAIKLIANDASTDKRVKKKLILVLGSWRDRYKDDPSMSTVAGLYSQCRVDPKRITHQEIVNLMGLSQSPEEKRRIEKQEAKLKAKQEKEEQGRKEEENRSKKKTPAFDFEKDKPKVLASIVEGSQASSNLVNAITLVNLATDILETNERVQECLTKAKQARKPVVRYIQLVENEELIGTLIETNDRIVAALEMYEKLLVAEPDNTPDSTAAITAGLTAANIGGHAVGGNRTSPTHNTNVSTKGKDRSTESQAHVHPDLEDLNFGSLGNISTNLPPPLRPSALSDDGHEHENADYRGSLSEFSDYESSDEETHKRAAGPSAKRRNYVTVSDNEDPPSGFSSSNTKTRLPVDDDPFADPFADK